MQGASPGLVNRLQNELIAGVIGMIGVVGSVEDYINIQRTQKYKSGINKANDASFGMKAQFLHYQLTLWS